MKKKLALAGALAMMVATTLAAVPAGATPTVVHKGANASVQGYVHIDRQDPRIAYVTGHYRCPSGDFSHLFVSVKQVADARPDRRLKEPGSSSIASAWLERHPVPDDEFTCDGSWHTNTFEIDSFTEYGFGSLVKGQVYLQFCLSGPGPDDAPQWFAFFEQFANAR
jgi:hypothetical protein